MLSRRYIHLEDAADFLRRGVGVCGFLTESRIRWCLSYVFAEIGDAPGFVSGNGPSAAVDGSVSFPPSESSGAVRMF